MHNHSLQLLENYENGVICNDTSLLVLKAAKSRKVFHFGSNLKKKVHNHSPEHYVSTKRDSTQGLGLARRTYVFLEI